MLSYWYRSALLCGVGGRSPEAGGEAVRNGGGKKWWRGGEAVEAGGEVEEAGGVVERGCISGEKKISTRVQQAICT